ncbi:MAG: hypothetical protein KME21_18915 [Desmonostoc vinosum HA7617-LM4]|nr:hypothetical protein [Desmonostoc vinosum HA7617-LM4]
MKNFKKLSTVVILLFAFAYPTSIAEAKSNSLNNVQNESSLETEADLVAGENGELLLAQRYFGRVPFYRRQNYRRQYIRRQNRRRFYRRQHLRRQFIRRQYRRQFYPRQNYRRQYIRRRYYPGRY